MTDVTINFMLLGKTGGGKSATGNMILNRKAFKVSAKVSSQTKEVADGFAEFDRCTLHAVDSPGLMDTDKDDVKDKETFATNMKEAISMCCDGVDAFLYVTKFGNKFTAEDRSALEALKAILGDGFMRHVIVVVTGGDLFQGAMEDEDRDVTFEAWCEEQVGPFRELYDACRDRFVLFNNREKNEQTKKAQIHTIVELSQNLVTPHCRYTSQCFEDAKFKRQKLILEKKAPQLRVEFQEKISLLTASVEALRSRPTKDEKLEIRKRVNDLREEIKKEDQGYGVLNDVLELVEQVEENINDVEKLQDLVAKLEQIRRAKRIMAGIGRVVEAVGMGIMRVKPLGGGITSGVACGVGFVTNELFEYGESKVQEQISDLNASLNFSSRMNQRKN